MIVAIFHCPLSPTEVISKLAGIDGLVTIVVDSITMFDPVPHLPLILLIVVEEDDS